LFGHNHQAPKPPKNEPFIILLIAFAIAAVLTVGYVWFMVMAEKVQQAG
jgi:hypothetical protein